MGVGLLAFGALGYPTAADAAIASFASAEHDLPKDLSSSEREFYDAVVGDQPDWMPDGQIFSDSGFRAADDAFGFMNYGDSLLLNQKFFGQPRPFTTPRETPQRSRLVPRDLRILFGDDVCIDGTASSPSSNCTLTESGEQVRRDAYSWAKAGHCFGFANVSAGAFSGYIDPAAFGVARPTIDTPLDRKVQRAFGRQVVVAHFGVSTIPVASALDVVAKLSALLAIGELPVVLILSGPPGGHAVVPYALYEGEGGEIDIGVYDPNFPGKDRAVKVDSRTGQWRYQGSPIPAQVPMLWDSQEPSGSTRMFLSPIEGNFAVQPCPFCQEVEDRTVVAFSPVRRENVKVFESIRLLDVDGRELDPSLVEVVPPVQSSYEWVSGPTLKVAVGVDFTVALSGAGVMTPEEFSISAYRPKDVKSVWIRDLRKTVSGIIEIGAKTPRVRVRLSAPQRVRVRQTVEEPDASFRFTAARVERENGPEIELEVNRGLKEVMLETGSFANSTVRLNLRSSSSQGQATFQVSDVSVPAGARIVVRYLGWRGDSGRPRVWIDLGSDGSLDERVPIRKVGR